MCGIAGFFGRRPVSGLAVDAMRAAIARRGPDAFHVAGCRVSAAQFVLQDEYAGLSSALLHARLSIRDPRPVADQPMASEDGDVRKLRLVIRTYEGEPSEKATAPGMMQKMAKLYSAEAAAK